jgi:predicted TIM-barrel fold metal-dependent hydrolase
MRGIGGGGFSMLATQKVVSADSHIFEPANLWEERIDRAYRDRAPRIIANHKGEEGSFFVAEGIKPRRIAGISALNVKPENLPAFNKAGVEDLRRGGWDPVERIKDQDTDGLSAEVIYATYAMYLFGVSDAKLQQACFRAYNDWIAEYCRHEPKRLIGLALISLLDVDTAVAELKRVSKLGLKGVMISVVQPDGVELSQARFDPFWASAAELELPVSLHILTDSRQGPKRFDSADFGAGFYMAIPHEMQLTLTDIIVRGVLERHPRLRLVLAEGDIGWLAHFLERIDRAHTRYAHQNKIFLDMPPSAYFHRQVYATFINDRVGVVNREFAGVDNLMWSSDYPHTDSCWPDSLKAIARDFAGVPDAHLDKMVLKNVTRLYRFELG